MERENEPADDGTSVRGIEERVLGDLDCDGDTRLSDQMEMREAKNARVMGARQPALRGTLSLTIARRQ